MTIMIQNFIRKRFFLSTKYDYFGRSKVTRHHGKILLLQHPSFRGTGVPLIVKGSHTFQMLSKALEKVTVMLSFEMFSGDVVLVSL